ncbi:MAG: HU family DNA-binding protein [Chloroflexi bacterium]|nr:HU family DNA-binding protein [Chloroflexota bacterium]
MNRTDLADSIAIENGLTRSEARRWLEAVLKAISGSLEEGAKVSLSGFGTFEVRRRGEKQGRNPRTGETLKIAPRMVVVFKPSASLNKSLGLPHEESDEGG